MGDKQKRSAKRRQADERTHPTETHKDLLQYDPEKARDLLDVDEAVESVNDMQRPNRTDPRHTDPSTVPEGDDVPQGFTTGRGMGGGSANRRKRQG
jgi:hypothetical protein